MEIGFNKLKKPEEVGERLVAVMHMKSPDWLVFFAGIPEHKQKEFKHRVKHFILFIGETDVSEHEVFLVIFCFVIQNSYMFLVAH